MAQIVYRALDAGLGHWSGASSIYYTHGLVSAHPHFLQILFKDFEVNLRCHSVHFIYLIQKNHCMLRKEAFLIVFQNHAEHNSL